MRVTRDEAGAILDVGRRKRTISPAPRRAGPELPERPVDALLEQNRRRGAAPDGWTKAIRSEEVAPEIVVDFNGDAQPISIEIISPDASSIDDILAVFDKLGIGRPDMTELDPRP